MTAPSPRDDFASFPAPAEGILVAMFITVRKVARSRDFYSRVLGGTVILEENPCTVRLSNSWIIMSVCLAFESCAGDQPGTWPLPGVVGPCCHIRHAYLPGIIR